MVRLIIPLLALNVVGSAAAADKLVEPLVNGRVIQTANVVAMIDVRAKSFGPGACSVLIGIGNRQILLMAPPLTYSGWVPVLSHTGPISVTASIDVKCDTGVLAEVRYFGG